MPIASRSRTCGFLPRFVRVQSVGSRTVRALEGAPAGLAAYCTPRWCVAPCQYTPITRCARCSVGAAPLLAPPSPTFGRRAPP